MCLAVPGRILEIRGQPDDPVGTVGTVDFQGSQVEVSLVLTPQARRGNWVLVHAGFALNVLDEEEARRTWEYLQPEDLEEVGDAAAANRPSGGGA
jgi:hydrogenase expression/formation protein HypC